MNLAILLLTASLAGCGGDIGAALQGQAGLLDFIKDGTTTKHEITLRLGDPGATYDDERVLTYRLGHDKGGYYVFRNKADWYGVCSNLVLALDGNDHLRQHSLVRVGDCS